MSTKDLKWSELPFGYVKADYNVRCTFKDGKWGPIEVSDSEYVPLHIAATCLHYGQEAFEGLKAFRGKDGKVRVFRMDENAKRFRDSALGIAMEPLPVEKFEEMVRLVVKLNGNLIPPYGSGASLYIRPLEIGMSARVGVSPADEYMVIMLVTPVGPFSLCWRRIRFSRCCRRSFSLGKLINFLARTVPSARITEQTASLLMPRSTARIVRVSSTSSRRDRSRFSSKA